MLLKCMYLVFETSKQAGQVESKLFWVLLICYQSVKFEFVFMIF